MKMMTDYLQPVFERAFEKLGIEDKSLISFEIPKNPEHGDLSANSAMQLARVLKKNPKQIGQDILSALELDKNIVESAEIAGAGFINLKFSKEFYINSLEKIIQSGENFGRQNTGNGIKTNVEYVSANPTGLLHLGHGRNAAVGDTIANLLDWLGYDVTREYYFNNAGNQMNNLAKSIYARYMQLFQPEFDFPENGYHGEYIKQIATDLKEKHGDSLKGGSEDDLALIRKFGEKWNFAKIEQTLKSMSIVQDVFYNENTLYEEGKIDEVVGEFKSRGLAYEKEGALWLKLSEMGLEDDRVIVKSTGEPTYRLPDIAYHREKFRRGFENIIDVFGSDHIATVPDVLAGVKSLGYDPDKVRVVIHQFVTLMEDGQQVKMSKRSGKSYTLDELLDELGPDVVRFFLIMRSVGTHLEFDLSLAREQSDKNPAFYIQYAHARINQIFANAAEKGIEIDKNPVLSLLETPEEMNVIKK
jgi:arginyl-tRNA synthetase